MRVESMDLVGRPSTSLVKCCNCGCDCNSLMNQSLSGTWLRSVKRKTHEVEGGERFLIPDFDLPQVARVEISNERDALREMVVNQQETIRVLSLELEEERNASSSAANETMSMILRLQREKAEIQMEARQFKRFAEEKMAHDQQEFSAMEDLLYKREEAIQALYCEVEAYKHRMMSYELSEVEADGERGTMSQNKSSVNVDGELELHDYPHLKCNLNENREQLEGDYDMCDDAEKYVFGETPRSHDHLKDLEFRINELERSPRPIPPDGDFASQMNVLEKVIVDHSPQQPSHVRRISNGSANSFFANGREMAPDSPIESPKFNRNFEEKDFLQVNYSNLRNIDTIPEAEDDRNVRVCTIDSVHEQITYNSVQSKPDIGVCDYNLTNPRESLGQADLGDPEIKKLYMRLQALEADRESMRQAIICMQTDKAQLVLLKEIAQHLCKEMTLPKKMPVKKRSLIESFSFISVFKWIWSFIFWRRIARQSKYMFGMSLQNAGLLMLLDKGPRIGQWRCLSRTQM